MRNSWLNRSIGLDLDYNSSNRWGDIYSKRAEYLAKTSDSSAAQGR